MIFFYRFNKYLNPDKYRNSAISLLDLYSIKDGGPQFQFLRTLLFYLERKFFEDLSGHLNLQDPESIKSTTVQAEDLPTPARCYSKTETELISENKKFFICREGQY